MKKNNLLALAIITIMLMICITTPAFALSKTETEHHLFTGLVPDVSALFPWPVSFGVSGDYSDYDNSYILNSVNIYAYLDSDRPFGITNGDVSCSVSQTIDYGSPTTHSIWSSYWEPAEGIFPGEAILYFNKIAYPDQTFLYLAEEECEYGFVAGEYLIYDPKYTLALSISGPK